MSMSAIAAGATSAPSQTVPGTGSGTSGDSGNTTFSRLLQGGTAAEGGASTQPSSPRQAASGKNTDAADRDAGRRPSTVPGQSGSAEDAEPAASADAGVPGQTDTTAETDDTATDGDWPPPGLASLIDPAAPPPAPVAGIGLAVPAEPVPDTPETTAGTPDDAQLPAGALAQAAARLQTGKQAEAGTTLPTEGATQPVAQAAQAPSALPDTAAIATASTSLADAPDPSATPFVIQGATPAQAAPSTASPALPLSAPQAPVPQLHGDAFADDIGTHVQWLAGQKIGHAHIRIAPQELGPVEIRLRLDGDRISADFSSAQPEVRQALESSLPRLREMLGQHGFQLAHAGVGQQSHSPQDGNRQASGGGDNSHDSGDAHADTGTGGLPAPSRILGRGLLDAYA